MKKKKMSKARIMYGDLLDTMSEARLRYEQALLEFALVDWTKISDPSIRPRYEANINRYRVEYENEAEMVPCQCGRKPTIEMLAKQGAMEMWGCTCHDCYDLGFPHGTGPSATSAVSCWNDEMNEINVLT